MSAMVPEESAPSSVVVIGRLLGCCGPFAKAVAARKMRDLGTLRYASKRGNEIYEQLPRGQFFAVANVTIPAASPAGHQAR